MKSRVLQVGPLKPSLAETLRTRYQAYVLPSGAQREPFLGEHGAEIIAAVTTGGVGVDAQLMSALPNLGAIVNFGVGYDTTDVDAAASRGVGVSNTPGVLDDCVADTAVALLLDSMRRFSASDRYLRAGRWSAEGHYPLTRNVSGVRVGIIGLGRIGTAIATRLRAFGCPISYHNRHEIPDSPYRYLDSPVALAREVDALVIAATGGNGTKHLVDGDVIAALGPDGYLINIARGSVIDQDALIDALREGRLAGAGLDVFDDEPNVPAALMALDNAVLLPHVGSATVETRAAMEALTLANLDRFLESGELLTPVVPVRVPPIGGHGFGPADGPVGR